MQVRPSSQAGCRASRKTSQGSKPPALAEVRSRLRAPRRWQTEAVAVQKHAASDSTIASCIRPCLAPLMGYQAMFARSVIRSAVEARLQVVEAGVQQRDLGR